MSPAASSSETSTKPQESWDFHLGQAPGRLGLSRGLGAHKNTIQASDSQFTPPWAGLAPPGASPGLPEGGGQVGEGRGGGQAVIP